MTNWTNLKVFLLGAIWAAIGGLGPAGMGLWDGWYHQTGPVNWHQIARIAAYGAGMALVGYWRKHKALLEMPPDTEPPSGPSASAARPLGLSLVP